MCDTKLFYEASKPWAKIFFFMILARPAILASFPHGASSFLAHTPLWVRRWVLLQLYENSHQLPVILCID